MGVDTQADIGRRGKKVSPALLQKLPLRPKIGERGRPVPPELLRRLNPGGTPDVPIKPKFLEKLFASKRLMNEPTVGHRQPYPHEVRAAVDWPLMQNAWQNATVQLVARWKLVRAAQAAELAEFVQLAVGARDAAALAGLTASVLGADEMYDAMERMLRSSARAAVEEARAQGVVMGELDVDALLPALRKQAESLAYLEAKSLSVSAANQALLRFGPDADPRAVAEYVYDHLLSLSDRGLQDTLGGALTQAQNAARAYVIGNGPEVSRIYASEILDQNTCPKCAAVDGTEYPDMEAALRDYPVGPYYDCDGWARCRGTLVAVYDETPATVGDDNVPGVLLPDPLDLVAAHLPGQHDQDSHGRRGGTTSDVAIQRPSFEHLVIRGEAYPEDHDAALSKFWKDAYPDDKGGKTVSDYVSHPEERWSVQLNSHIRSGGVNSQDRRVMNKLDPLTETAEFKDDAIVWRSAQLGQAVTDTLVPGATLVDPGYKSTAWSRTVAEVYLDSRKGEGRVPVLFETVVPKGTKFMQAWYGETVFGRGVNFEILDAFDGEDSDGNPVRHVVARAVGA